MPNHPDPEVQRAYSACQEHGDVGDSAAEWPNNVLSKQAVALRSGRLCRGETRPAIEPSPARVEELRAMADEAAAIMDGIPVGMGSDGNAPWFPLWVAAGAAEEVPELTETSSSRLVDWWFGNSLFPGTTVAFLPLGGPDGLLEVMHEDEDSEGDLGETDFRAQAATDQLLAWLSDRRFLRAGLLFIGNKEELASIPRDDYPPGTEQPGSVHPRAFVGQLADGSLAGVFSYAVNT